MWENINKIQERKAKKTEEVSFKNNILTPNISEKNIAKKQRIDKGKVVVAENEKVFDK